MRAKFLALMILALIALVSFLGILTELNKKFGIETPAFGGTLREGIVGNPRFINPLLAQSDADRDMVSLVYTGIMRHDETGNPQPALAESYELSQNGLTYTVVLKDKLYWPDGEKLTADDVVFTIGLAKNPFAQSPRRANWEGVDVEKVDDKTIRFHLKKSYVPFLESLTLGILPKHLWEKIPPSQITLAELNINPVGAGPYKIESIKRDSLGSITALTLTANKYFVLGMPNIKSFSARFYANEEAALKDLHNGSIDSYGAVSPKNIEWIGENLEIKKISLRRIIAVFLNQSAQKAFASSEIRRALNAAVNKKELIEKVLKTNGEVIDGPLPWPAKSDSYDPDLAENTVAKSKSEIRFTLTTAQTQELVEIAEIIKNMWNAVGFSVEIKTFPVNDLEQSVIGPRRYDAFLYGEEVIGSTPDPFAFWHSSQRNHPGYNIALYTNSKVDKLLEEVRVEQNQEKRGELYENIQNEIRKDLPAIFLFSPYYLYAIPKGIGGIDFESISTGSERFATVHNWYLKRKYVWKIFYK